jgi:hypothetical protein
VQENHGFSSKTYTTTWILKQFLNILARKCLEYVIIYMKAFGVYKLLPAIKKLMATNFLDREIFLIMIFENKYEK